MKRGNSKILISGIYLRYLLIVVLLFAIVRIQAQTNDNIIWASLKLKKNFDQKTSAAIAPIFRLNDDISNYQNMSVDYSIQRKLGKGWSVQLLGRTWFIPDGNNRQFIWFDVAYGKQFGSFKAASSLRLHYALDLKDRNDADFIRWKTSLSFLGLGKIKPFIAIEPWFQLNGITDLRRMRYEPGVTCNLAQGLDLTVIYRREETVELEPSVNFNMYVITLSYLLPAKEQD